ncbi:MAG TPA: SMP-30/gluconolactonase/LRE family protein [Candidatus Eisenbacteria bacterium]|nr:SMP-30/gluconolactonase/LRE family protein [Candidatus Eisenbacteria bacterium]
MNAVVIRAARVAATVLLLGMGPVTATAGAMWDDATPTGTADAAIDLASADGLSLIRGTWRFHDVSISEVAFRSVGADLKPSGPPNRTYDFDPHAGAADFDDSQWETIDPATLSARRSNGRLCFDWYRLTVTVPERIGDFDPTGASVVFDIVVDDYAEVWVDGRLSRELGQRGGGVVAGWNAPNRLVIGRGVRPGQKIQLAVFGINGPISASPENYIWIRSARLEFYRAADSRSTLRGSPVEVFHATPALEAIVPSSAVVEKLADGFQFTEGPVWSREGALLFSDPNTNAIYRWTSEEGVTVYRRNSGYDGADVGGLHQPGSNGLAFDAQGRLTICEHGNRRVTRLESDGRLTVLADRYEGKRLNSPNDLVYRSDGALYFTDPPFGLPKVHDDPARELTVSGVFCLKDGKLRLVADDFTGPNGIAFSPDERFLYVSNWDVKRKAIMRHEVTSDGSLRNGRVFFDMTGAPGEEALDGLKVDRAGNVYSSGPGGVWVFSPAGKHLGTLRFPELPANMAWGDPDRRTLYLCARTGLYRVRLEMEGAPVAMRH